MLWCAACSGSAARVTPRTRGAATEKALTDGLVGVNQRVHLNDLLDLPQPTELRGLYDAMDNPTRNRGNRATVAALVRGAELAPADSSGGRGPALGRRLILDHLATLTETDAACPALLIMTARLEGDPLDRGWRVDTGASPLLTIDLGPLRPQEAACLVDTYLEANSEFARRCVERAAGNPLFLEQLLRHAEDISEGGVPISVQSLVQARMDLLDAADKQALQAAAILGQQFTLDALRHLTLNPGYTCTGLIAHLLVKPQVARRRSPRRRRCRRPRR